MPADYKQPDKRDKSFAKKYRPAILLAIALILGSGGIYLLLKSKKSARLSGKEPQRCMYWSNDRYLPVSCDKKIGDTLLIAYDSIKMATFKKIIQFDTIREGSLGRVWYIKINGRVEYFMREVFTLLQQETLVATHARYDGRLQCSLNTFPDYAGERS